MAPPFKQQLIPALVDKGWFLAAAVLGALFVARMLERYKARRAMRVVVAPERLERVAEIARQLGTIDRGIENVAARRAASWQELERDLVKVADLEPGAANELMAGYERRWAVIKATDVGEIQHLNALIKKLKEDLSDDRFWLGPERLQWVNSQVSKLEIRIAFLDAPPAAAVTRARARATPKSWHRFAPKSLAIGVGWGFLLWAQRRRPRMLDVDEVVKRLAR